MQILDGNLLSAKIKDEVLAESDSNKITPILAVITFMYDEVSKTYIDNIRSACEYCDMSMMHFIYDEDTKESTIIKKIKELNKDKNVNGIIIDKRIPEKIFKF